jgi:transcriptional regulator with XRE-family HTH domain
VNVQLRPPAEADLIRQHREASVPEISRRQAAAMAGLSASQWSDVERGQKKAGPGVAVPVQATAETLARMAQVAGVSAEELEAAGRADAADQLRALEGQQRTRQRLVGIPGLGVIAETLPRAASEELLPIVAEALDAIGHSVLSGDAKRELTRAFIDNLIHDVTRRYSELLLMLRLASGHQPG